MSDGATAHLPLQPLTMHAGTHLGQPHLPIAYRQPPRVAVAQGKRGPGSWQAAIAAVGSRIWHDGIQVDADDLHLQDTTTAASEGL